MMFRLAGELEPGASLM